MKEDVINIMNSVHIDVVGDKVKIECDPKRDNLPIEVVEEIVKATINQCQHEKEKDLPAGLVEAVAKKYDEHVFNTMMAWRTVSFILMAGIAAALIFWR